ncbi:hypothetical protein HMPREF3191_01660 [Veillonellaceae bacterium DNF00626]|nr:hypothetical protein HMPREF3191_01660 [Veillonellaceae bacterium DNF00626]
MHKESVAICFYVDSLSIISCSRFLLLIIRFDNKIYIDNRRRK